MLTANKKGFSIKFPNGVTVSVQWGAGNYCENFENSIELELKSNSVSAENAEIDIWNSTTNLTEKCELAFDGSMTHVPPTIIIKVLAWAEAL